MWARFRPCALSAVLRVHNHREPNGKGRTLSPSADGNDISSHEPTEAPADGEAQSRTPILLSRRGVALDILLKQRLQLLGGQANSRILHTEEVPIAPLPFLTGDLQRNAAMGGKFAGVAQQIEQALFQPRAIGVHGHSSRAPR